MEKLKIGNTEFDLVPMGITEDSTRKTRSFKFISASSYNDVIYVVSGHISTIQHIGNDGNPLNTYGDIAKFKSLSFEKDVELSAGVLADVYKVTYSTDAVEKAINELNNQIDDLSNTIVIISMQMF